MSKVWYPGFINKSILFEIQGSLLQIFEIFLAQRPQRVRLNRQKGDWPPVKACVPEEHFYF